MDFGGKTCGVALSDPLMITAQPLEIIRRDRENKLRRTLARIEELIIEYEVGLIILGLPLNMDDTQGERARKTLEFKEDLHRRTGLPVIMSDERLTTVEAEEIMKKQGIPRDNFQIISKITANSSGKAFPALNGKKSEHEKSAVYSGRRRPCR